MTAGLTLPVVLLCGLWPFGGSSRGERLQDVVTIGELEGRQLEMPAAAPVHADTRDALEQYRRFLELPEADPELQREALRRLGDLSLSIGELESLENPDYAKSMAFHRDAIRVYEHWLASNLNDTRADRVLYQLARAYDSAGDTELALAVLSRLVTHYPDSTFMDEARFRQGELFFSQQDFNAAGDAFAAVVLNHPDSSYFQQSLYKYAWSQFKLGEYDRSTVAFLDLLQLRLRAAAPAAGENSDAGRLASMTRPERELVDDTLRALSLTFAFLDGPDSINAWLDLRQGDSAWLLYTRLGELYREQERYLDAAGSYGAFVARDALHPYAPAASTTRIEAYQDGRFPGLVLEGKQEFVAAYGLDAPYWSAHEPGARPDVVNALKAHLSDLAVHDHALAQESGLAADYARAADWYRRYLAYFPADPESAQRSFLLGEILTESGDYSGATEFYERAAYAYPGYERAAEAGYAGLLASTARLAQLQGSAHATWQKVQWQRGLRFATFFPMHPQATAVLTDTAEQYFSAGQLMPALRVSGQLLTSVSVGSLEQRKVAWTVVAHSHFDLGHYPRAERAYQELRALGGGPTLNGTELDERLAAAIYRQAEAAEAAGANDEAVMNYLRVAVAAPAAAAGANAQYDAATLLLRAEDWNGAIEVLTAFQRAYPAHRFNDDIVAKLAIAYQSSGQTLAAANEYERVSNLQSMSGEGRQEALWKSAELYEQAGDIGPARAAWQRYVERYPYPVSESIEVQQRLADLARRMQDENSRRDWLRKIIASDSLAAAERNDRTRTLAARATLELAEPRRAAFAAVKLTAPLADTLKLKRNLMEAALKAYDDAASYGVAEITTVATYQVADLYFQLGNDLLDSERPAGLNADELEQYELLLEEQAFPFEEKAIELFEVNTTRALAGVYDEWVARSYERLATLIPARYAKTEKAENYVSAIY